MSYVTIFVQAQNREARTTAHDHTAYYHTAVLEYVLVIVLRAVGAGTDP